MMFPMRRASVRATRDTGCGRGRAAVERLEGRTLFAVQVGGFVDELVANNISRATAMEFAPDGRLFVAEQNGALRVIKNGALLTNSFTTLSVDSSGERGLLGVAFDPAFTANGHVYVYYTVPAATRFNRISRFTAADADPGPGYAPGDTAQAGSELVLVNLDPLSGATNHNGGAIHFGPDGKLYAAVGDNANGSNAQTLANRHGKMLRINPDGSAPSDNPFFTNDNTFQPRDHIWALGLRNPFTFAFDPADGTMHINDVGQSAWEEIDVGRAGANYGWPTVEGPETTPNPNFDDPLFVYGRTGPFDETGTVIAGGTFYRRPAGAANPLPDAFNGDYFYADSGHGWIRWLDDNTANSSLILNGTFGIVDLKTGPDGSVYYLHRGGSSVRRLRYTVTPPTAPDLAPASDTGFTDTDNVTSDNTPTFTGTAPAGSTVRIFADGLEVGSVTVAAGTGVFSVTTSALAAGARVITATATLNGNPSATSAPLTITIDRTAPAVTASSFDIQTGQRVRFQFNEDVGRSVGASDLTVVNLTTGQTVPQTAFTLTANGSPGDNLLVEYRANALLPDGNYRATLGAADVTDAAGNPLAADQVVTFFVLAGDANQDRRVDSSDFSLLASHFGRTGQTWGTGDFNADGRVDSSDFSLLASGFGRTLPAPARAADVVTATATRPAKRRPAPVVSPQPRRRVAPQPRTRLD